MISQINQIALIYDYNREALITEVDFSLSSVRLIRVLNQLIECRGKPFAIRCGNGPEYISNNLKQWAKNNNVELWYIQPGNPQQNGYVERFNRTMRYELLNQCLFENIEQVRRLSEEWVHSKKYTKHGKRLLISLVLDIATHIR